LLTDLEIYLFDLRGYLLIEQALSQDEVVALNAGVDAILPLKVGEWAGYVHGQAYGTKDGRNLQQIYEGGEPFECLIDHPSWINKVKHFVGGDGTFDYHPSPLFIDEDFVNIRGPGGLSDSIQADIMASNAPSFAIITGASCAGRSTF